MPDDALLQALLSGPGAELGSGGSAPLANASAGLSAATGFGGGGGGGGLSRLPALPQGTSIPDIINSVQQINATMARSNEEAVKTGPIITATSTPGGSTKWTIDDLDHEDMASVREAMGFYRQAQQGYQEQIDRYSARERAMTTGLGPIFNALAVVGGNLAAADPRLPPVVQALGRSALQLNPSLDRIQAQKAELLGEQANIAQKQEAVMGGLASRRLALEQAQATQDQREMDKRLEREFKAKQQEDKLYDRLSTRTTDLIKNGKAMTESAFDAMAGQLGLTDKERIKDAYIAHKDKAAQMAQAIKEGRTEEEYKIKLRGEEQRANQVQSYMLKDKLADKQADRAKELATFKGNLKAETQLSVVAKDRLDSLADFRNTELYLNGVEDLLKNPTYSKLMGFQEALAKPLPPYLKSADRVELESYMAHEIPRILRMIQGKGQGGASMLRIKAGQEIIASLGVMPQMTPKEGMRVLGNLRHVISSARQPIVEEFPKAQWENYQPLLGNDYQTLLSRIRNFYPQGGAPAAGAAPAAGSEFSFNDFMAKQGH